MFFTVISSFKRFLEKLFNRTTKEAKDAGVNAVKAEILVPESEGVTHESLSFKTTDAKVQPHFQLFALLIGINTYSDPGIENLHGAVADTEAVSSFLRDSLGVPAENILHLLDQQATADAIKHGIKSFIVNERLQHGDPILIYFAGHGSETKAPDSWPPQKRNKVQMLLPYDFELSPVNPSSGQGIVDRSLAALLQKVAMVKGDNITVVLDCCHAGSGTREPYMSANTLTRGVRLPDDYQIYPELDADILVADNGALRGAAVARPYEYGGLRSHVLLAACREDQIARERDDRGLFTLAVLTTIRRIGFHKLTYKNLILNLPDFDKEQDPQCEGIHRSRFLFSRQDSVRREKVYDIHFDYGANNSKAVISPSDQRQALPYYTIHVGEASGITPGTEFTVYKDYEMESAPLGTLYAVSVSKFSSLLRPFSADPSLNLSAPAYAAETRAGHRLISLKIATEPNLLKDLGLQDVWEREPSISEALEGITFVECRDDADLALLIDKQMVGFEILDSSIVHLGLQHTLQRRWRSIDDILNILYGAATFFYNLRRSNKERQLASKVEFQCMQLDDSLMEDGSPINRPQGSNLNGEGLIELTIDEDDPRPPAYGFKIINRTRTPFYVHVFFFGCSDLSIVSFYEPNVAHGDTHCLPPETFLTIGYGSTGTVPQEFHLHNGESTDVGFIRMFLSTEYVDLSDMKQSPLFEETEGSGRYARPVDLKRQSSWAVTTIAILQKRRNTVIQ